MPDNGEGTKAIDFNSPEVQAAIAAAVEKETSGLKANRDAILEEKRKTKEQLDQLAETWKGLDPQQIRAIVARMQNDEEAKLIAEGKVDQVLQKRTEALRRDAEAQVAAALKKAGDLEEALKGKESKIAELVIDAQVREAAVVAKVHASSIPDIVARARSLFRLTDDYGVEARDKNGAKVYGKDGKSALTPSEWLGSMKKDAPHWWPASTGGGAGGGTGSGGTGDTANADKLSPRQKLTLGMRQSQGDD